MVYGWAARKGAEYQEQAMAAPSRRGFVLLAVLELGLAALFAGFLTAGQFWLAPVVLVVAALAGWATTRFLVHVSAWLRRVVVISAVLGMLALGVFASPVAGMGLLALFAYAGGWFLTFAVAPSRAVRWRAVTRGRR
ncbi:MULTISPECIES: hypothetical protein [unclassified Pseudoclavibacter]|uniref:hypothetical protein n=1 Tax=unclassified Pseudoclavibacter TaxID=2615177 RepID=UPI0012F2B212|nr:MULTISPECIES: hypothetical protein [unclassified Pseudoclavibacter]MBF4460534.1 hypothetical protein [Pseudoclavibacter sp. VKM Ac-2867]VXB11095.1 conserved membrane hypothetical protein [Pseudoclavibacter sp. 8L]